MAGRRHEVDNGRWYTHLDSAYDKEHRGRAIENGRVISIDATVKFIFCVAS